MQWSSNFAYAIGLFTADGCLSSDGRHLEFCSKDKEQVMNFINCLNLRNNITKKYGDKEKTKECHRVQFGNIRFYNYLKEIGLTPKKSLILKELKIPKIFFPDFLRGFFDGDGNFRKFTHPQSQHPQIRVRFTSASPLFLRWLRRKINHHLGINGYISNVAKRYESLEYAISDSLKVLKFMYHSPGIVYLPRKFRKIEPYLRT